MQKERDHRLWRGLKNSWKSWDILWGRLRGSVTCRCWRKMLKWNGKLLANGYLGRNSIIFIDEIESALHPKAVCQFLDMIDNIANEMGLQVFITSHSYFVIIIFQIEDSAQYKEKLRQILPKKRKLSIRSTYKRLLKRCRKLEYAFDFNSKKCRDCMVRSVSG